VKANGFFYIFEIKTMQKYTVIKPFFKLSEGKNYLIGDIIELTPEDAKRLDWYVVEQKAKK
jgi:hypothetical protein